MNIELLKYTITTVKPLYNAANWDNFQVCTPLAQDSALCVFASAYKEVRVTVYMPKSPGGVVVRASD